MKKFGLNFLFMLVVTLLAVEFLPNENPYVFVLILATILSIGLYGIDRFFKNN